MTQMSETRLLLKKVVTANDIKMFEYMLHNSEQNVFLEKDELELNVFDYAIYMERWDIVRIFIISDFGVDSLSEKMKEKLYENFHLKIKGPLPRLEELYIHPKDFEESDNILDFENKLGYKPVVLSVINGNYKLFYKLLFNGVRLNVTDSKGNTLLSLIEFYMPDILKKFNSDEYVFTVN